MAGGAREVDVWTTYKKIKVVGRGAFGSAYLCRGKRSTSLVVVKELFGNMSEEERTTSVGEIQVLSMLRHPNIIAYYDSFVSKEAGKGSTSGTLMVYPPQTLTSKDCNGIR